MNKADLIKRLELPEWDEFEVKEASRELPKSIWSTVSAFANTRGGIVVLGIREDKADKYIISGVENPDKVQNDFITTLRSDKFNCQLSSRGHILDFEGKYVLVFRITEMPRQAKPIFFNDDIRNTYIRFGGSDQKAGKAEIQRLLREASSFSSDSVIVESCSIDDIDAGTVRSYRQFLEARDPSHPFLALPDKELLNKLGCLNDSSVTIAGLVLFGKTDSISRYLPSFELNVYEMPEDAVNDERWKDRKIYQDNLINTYINCLAYLKGFIKIPFRMSGDGITRVELVPSYTAIREALANLLMHMDYFDRGIPAVRIYHDRITFRNPGPPLLNIDEIISNAETAPRNPVIAKAFRLAGWAELAGSGMLKIMNQWIEAGYDKPVISNSNPRGWFSLEMPMKETDNLKGSSEKSSEKILNLMKEKPEISAEEIAGIINISSRAVEKQIASLRDKGLIRRVGPAKGGHWEVL